MARWSSPSSGRSWGDIAGYFFGSDQGGRVPVGTFRDRQYAMIGCYRVPGETVAELRS